MLWSLLFETTYLPNITASTAPPAQNSIRICIQTKEYTNYKLNSSAELNLDYGSITGRPEFQTIWPLQII